MKYKASRDLLEFSLEYRTVSPSKLAEVVLNRRNVKITPESVTMWFKRHSEIFAALSKELVDGLPTSSEAADQTIFQNGNFQEISSIKNWIMEMNARDLSPKTIESQLICLKVLCQGVFQRGKIDLVAEGKWCIKHPDRLTLNDAIEIISLMKQKDIDTYPYKRSVKDFLISKGVVIGKKIAVGRSKSYGTYAKLYVDMPKLGEILTSVEIENYEAYAADLFMFKTGTRVTATVSALIENIIPIGDHAQITVFDKGRQSKYPKGHPWDKRIDAQLFKVLAKVIGERKVGKIFTIDREQLGDINAEAIRRYAPDTLARFPDVSPNHFWRHMFAQHMLRITNWNYALVASLGGWTPQALEESYGKPPDEIVKAWADKFQLNIEVPQVASLEAQ